MAEVSFWKARKDYRCGHAALLLLISLVVFPSSITAPLCDANAKFDNKNQARVVRRNHGRNRHILNRFKRLT
jgi:hypothetical protein